MTATKEAIELAQKMHCLFKEADDKRDKNLSKNIPEVQRFDDIPYGPIEKWHWLDIYRPRNTKEKLPIIINIHGGGWVYGTKETYQFYGMSLAKKDFAFVNINYRLAPSVEFPSELDDINLAVHWLTVHAEEYGLDLDNVFLVGDSAGGQMTLQYLAILMNNQFRKLFHYERPTITVRAAAINCGATFLTLPNAIAGAPEAYFTKESREKYPELLLTENYLTDACPPLFIMTATDDFLRDHSVRLDGFLMAKGIGHEFHLYGTPDNPRGHVFHCNIKDELAQKCNEDELVFFRKHIVK